MGLCHTLHTWILLHDRAAVQCRSRLLYVSLAFLLENHRSILYLPKLLGKSFTFSCTLTHSFGFFVVLRVFPCTSRSLRVWFHCEPTCPYHAVFACCCLLWLAPDVSWYLQPQYVVRCTFIQPVKHTSCFTTQLTSATCPTQFICCCVFESMLH